MKLDQEILNWLLEPDQPAVRYYTLLDLLEYSNENREVRKAYSDIPKFGWAPQIFRTQKPGGFWESRNDLYLPKYTATIWRLIVLSDLGLTAKDQQIRVDSSLTSTLGPMVGSMAQAARGLGARSA